MVEPELLPSLTARTAVLYNEIMELLQKMRLFGEQMDVQSHQGVGGYFWVSLAHAGS